MTGHRVAARTAVRRWLSVTTPPRISATQRHPLAQRTTQPSRIMELLEQIGGSHIVDQGTILDCDFAPWKCCSGSLVDVWFLLTKNCFLFKCFRKVFVNLIIWQTRLIYEIFTSSIRRPFLIGIWHLWSVAVDPLCMYDFCWRTCSSGEKPNYFLDICGTRSDIDLEVNSERHASSIGYQLGIGLFHLGTVTMAPAWIYDWKYWKRLFNTNIIIII